MNSSNKALCALAMTALASAANAQAITQVMDDNTSSASSTGPIATFATEAALVSPPSINGATASFTHRMAARNTRIATGGVAQTHKRNVIYQLDFTVEDPNNLGFRLSVESVLRGVSSITQTSTTNSAAVATGIEFLVTWDDSTDAPDTYTTFIPFVSVATDGVQVIDAGSVSELQESIEDAEAGLYTGTTSFSFRFTTAPTPTTNVFFQNNETGDGLVEYGVGPLPAGFEHVNPSDLGHFLTFSAFFLLLGDTNGDGVVDFADLNAVLSQFGEAGDPGFTGADVNDDGVVNFADLNIVLSNFGNSLN